MNNQPRAILAGHGDFAAGMLTALVQITGRSDVFAGFSNRALSGVAVEQEMSELLARTGALVIFTDLPAGSCAMAARKLQRRQPELALGLGVNLGALLNFSVRDDVDAVTAACDSVEKGKGTMLFVPPGEPRGA